MCQFIDLSDDRVIREGMQTQGAAESRSYRVLIQFPIDSVSSEALTVIDNSGSTPPVISGSSTIGPTWIQTPLIAGLTAGVVYQYSILVNTGGDILEIIIPITGV